MTVVLPHADSEVVEATQDDLRAAIRHALDRSGYTFEELAAQAATGHFATTRARLAWVAIGDLGELAE